MSEHRWFVDETKQHGYVLVASVHRIEDLDELRKTVRGLVLRGQRRLHMTKESDPRRRKIAAALRDAGVTATIYDAHRNYADDLAARSACLAALAADATALGGGTLILEQDDSLLVWDRRQLYRLVRPLAGQIQYQHFRAADELLLCVPDAIGWCWAKGGDWRRRIKPLIEAVQPV